jgi:transcriptional regulator GlxA family with amidase domain
MESSLVRPEHTAASDLLGETNRTTDRGDPAKAWRAEAEARTVAGMSRRSPGARSSFRAHVVVLRDSTPFVPVGIVEMLRKASAVASTLPGAPSGTVRVQLVAPGRSRTVACSGGLRLHCEESTATVRRSDLVVIPALDPDVDEHLARNKEVVPWLRRRYLAGADVASVCTGAFVLGAAGLLDGRAATTHWAFQELLARRYPRTQVLPQAILVDQGRVLTAGGATSFLNLALHIVERVFGAEVARASSKMFLIDVNKAPQSAYAMFSSQKLHEDQDILRAQSMIERQPERTPPVDRLARDVAMSPRTFARRFRHSTGNSPREYIQRVKVEAAKRALESGERVSAVAGLVGYTDAAAFRRLFARVTGLTPADYRARYGPSSAPVTIVPRALADRRG